jgi:hypothetical protein
MVFQSQTVMTTVFYVYTDARNGLFYYYDTSTKKTAFQRPTGAVRLLDPKTGQPFAFPDADPPAKPDTKVEVPETKVEVPETKDEMPETKVEAPEAKVELPDKNVEFSKPDLIQKSSSSAIRQRSKSLLINARSPVLRQNATDTPAELPSQLTASSDAPTDNLVIDAPPSVREFRAETLETQQTRETSFFPDARHRALPGDLKAEIEQFQMADFASKFFRERRGGHVFARRKISVESLTSFQRDPLKLPLLLAHSKSSAKLSIECFRQILSYTGASEGSGRSGLAMTAVRLLTSLVGCPEIRDEVYFQLMKQTRGNPDATCLHLTWNLFVIVSTNIPSSRDSEKWVKAHLFRAAREASDPAIGDAAQFAYIRFSARCAVGRVATDISTQAVGRIPDEVKGSSKVFGASVYEQLWNQRKKYPLMPIPVTVHLIAEAILAAGAERTEGVFRRPGNMQKIKAMQEAINVGQMPIAGADIHDLASLFKAWFSSLPEPILGSDILPELKTGEETKLYVSVVAQLQPAHAAVLKYLVGFLRKLTLAENVTLMGASNLAICFAPNLVDMNNLADHLQARAFCNMAQEFFTSLIATCDTAASYPLKPELLEAPTAD